MESAFDAIDDALQNEAQGSKFGLVTASPAMLTQSEESINDTTSSPDEHARGLLTGTLNPLRYRERIRRNIDPSDAGGMLYSLVRDGSRLLDVGCGTGTLAEYLAHDRDVYVLGIEPDLKRAELARDRGLDVIHGIADEGTLAGRGLFDVILFADVLEHVASPADLIDLVARSLTPTGRIIASIPNVAHWSVRLSLLLGKFDYAETGIMDATHLRWFTRRTVGKLFNSCGFEIISLQATAGTWMPEYNSLPWSLFPVRLRHALVRRLARSVPSLFGCQHIVEAKLIKNPS